MTADPYAVTHEPETPEALNASLLEQIVGLTAENGRLRGDVEAGERAATEKIVAWLRTREREADAKLNERGGYPDWHEHERDIYGHAVDAIERGEHG